MICQAYQNVAVDLMYTFPSDQATTNLILYFRFFGIILKISQNKQSKQINNKPLYTSTKSLWKELSSPKLFLPKGLTPRLKFHQQIFHNNDSIKVVLSTPKWSRRLIMSFYMPQCKWAQSETVFNLKCLLF